MKKISFELKIILTILIAVLIVGTIGIIAYNGMTKIVNSISEEAKPDLKLALLKNILSDLSDAESSVKTYSITNDDTYLIPYYQSVSSFEIKIDSLYRLSKQTKKQQPIIDSINFLIGEKFFILNEFLVIQHNDRVDAALQKITNKVIREDTNIVDEQKKIISEQKESNFFQRVFGKKKKEEIIENQITPHETNNTPIKKFQQEIFRIKQQEAVKTKELIGKQLELTRKDKEVMDKIRLLLAELEEQETIAISKKTKEAQATTASLNNIIAVFCIGAAMLLFTVGFVVISYSRKNKAYTKALGKAKEEAENLAKAKERFLATMSHEIRTPLNVISGFAEQLLQTSLKDEQKKLMEIIQKSTEHLTTIINDILDYSKLEASKIELEKIIFSPKEILEEVAMMMKPEAENKFLQFSFDIQKNIQHFLIGDPIRLRQILLNLLSNAIKFTQKGSILVKVFSTLQDETTMQLHLIIKDTGIGIPQEKIKTIFNEFEQADSSTTRKFGGTGLGLTITKKLLEIQNGIINITNNEPKGTVISIIIPYKVGTSDSLPHQIKISKELNIFQNKIFLIADDERYNRMLLIEIFKKWGADFSEVENGQQAVDELLRKSYDAVLMDMRMPIMDGTEATKTIRTKLKGEKARVPIIALTAVTVKEDIERALAAGMNDFISKPFKEKELYDKLVIIFNGNKNIVSANITSNNEKKEEKYESIENILTELRQLANGDEKFVKDMVELFVKTTEEGISKIKNSVTTLSWIEVADAAHKIAAPCIHFNAKLLYGLLNEIEEKARNKENTDRIPELVHHLEKEAAILMPLLKKKFNE